MMARVNATATPNYDKPPLVLIAGWGHRASVWQDLAVIAEPWFDVHLLDLPGYGAATQATGRQYNEAQVIQALAKGIPAQSLVCGWSLGGMLATKLAAQYPERVRALVTLCSNPVFVARDDWPVAMPPDTFASFSQRVGSDPETTLNRFQRLAALGSGSSRQDLRHLRELLPDSPPPSNAALVNSLGWLAELDARVAIATLGQPQLHLLGRKDALVPAAVGAEIAALNPAARVEVLPGVAHLPLVSCPELVLERLQGILNCGASRHVASTG